MDIRTFDAIVVGSGAAGLTAALELAPARVAVLAHPECPPDVLAASDFVGSTSGLIQHLDARRPPRVVLITECSMSDNVAVENPDVEFVRPCNLCPHMKRITLPRIRHALETLTAEVTIPAEVAERARRAVERMVAVGRGGGRA